MKKPDKPDAKVRLENKKLVLEELRTTFDRIYSASDILDSKLQNIFNFLNIVVSIAPTLEIALSPSIDKISVFFLFILIAIFILYFISFFKISSTLEPMNYQQPISKDWDTLVKNYFDIKKEQALNRIISEYLIVIETIQGNNLKKITTLKQVSRLMAVIVLLLLIAVPVNIFISSPTLNDFINSIRQFVVLQP